jgi:hypothetical protein
MMETIRMQVETAHAGGNAVSGSSPGARFARALAAKDPAALRGCLAEGLDFQALTPGRHWEAGSPAEVVDGIVLGRWFDGEADIRELRSVAEGRVAGRGKASQPSPISPWLTANRLARARFPVPVLV